MMNDQEKFELIKAYVKNAREHPPVFIHVLANTGYSSAVKDIEQILNGEIPSLFERENWKK